MTDEELIAMARKLGPQLRANGDPGVILGGWLLAELADRLASHATQDVPHP